MLAPQIDLPERSRADFGRRSLQASHNLHKNESSTNGMGAGARHSPTITWRQRVCHGADRAVTGVLDCVATAWAGRPNP